ncbi:MAG TPA: hypothetical protein PKV96_02930 [Candidatus Saccharimonas sp.]|jgi:chromosome segregation ATPase|nr:hypothetical protein [Candidatus Saccharimonas sp.]
MTKAAVTNDEIMSALSQFANNVDTRFDKLESDVAGLKSDVAGLKSDVAELKSDVAGLKSDVAELKADVSRIYGILDGHMSRIETLIQETKVQAHQQERLERWIFQLADKAGVQLRYDG